MSCSPTTKNVAFTPTSSRASSTSGVESGSGPSSNVSATPLGTRSRAGNFRQRSAVSTISRYGGTGSALGALLAGLEQALAQLRLLLRRGVEAGEVGQRVEPFEAEQLLEERGGAVQHGAELRAPRLLDQAALEQRRHRRLGGDAADPCDLRPRDGLQVRD